MAKKTEWKTPTADMKYRETVLFKLENSGWGPIDLQTDQPITYFNNPSRLEFGERYDRFFQYTRVFPLSDQRKIKDNIQFSPDVRENIFEQEKDKPIPILTSMTYGLAARVPYDYSEASYKRLAAMADFNRRRGVMRIEEREPQ